MTNIGSFKNIHNGRRLFILASGPSLSTLDLSPLNRRIVMGLNRSGFIFTNTHYHVAMDHRLFDLHPDLLKNTRYLFTLEGRPWGIPMELLGAEGFSWDLEEGVYSGYTVSYVGLQIAVYMGFKEIYYLGLDLKHKGSNTHFFGHDFHSENHEMTEFPKMIKMLHYGADALAESDVKVFNCSPVSNLECFPKATYEHAISL
ncbi:hypothetical protein UR09_02645 [Candidatus Nitromaritima sp. SCGC AAA799-A02]|nr:hypothetical protein UR09_02645 [Candidatus Nitromaritima sp. SCGC AAA799-A02]KMP11876.1 hypothetical protein UZ36_02865 [Candidatus Nitromaritima sp. SCGC AAA799-C22]